MTYTTDTQQAPISFNRTSIDEQALTQAELYSHLEEQTQAVAPEEYTSIEISFYDHEIYFNGQLIAKITYDSNDFVTQPWLVLVNDKEEFRANAWAKCYRYICTHHKDGSDQFAVRNSQFAIEKLSLDQDSKDLTPFQDFRESVSLPEQEQETPTSTGNEIMVQIAEACENLGLELLNDGVYRGDVRLGEVGCIPNNCELRTANCELLWWFIRTDESQQKVPCESAMDCIYWLSMVDAVLATKTFDYDHLLDLPFDQLTSVQWEHLQKYEPVLEFAAA